MGVEAEPPALALRFGIWTTALTAAGLHSREDLGDRFRRLALGAMDNAPAAFVERIPTQFTPAELAVPTHRRREAARGWGAVEGRLQYAIWVARQQDALALDVTDGRQQLTAAGLSRQGEPTGYAALDARRRAAARSTMRA